MSFLTDYQSNVLFYVLMAVYGLASVFAISLRLDPTVWIVASIIVILSYLSINIYYSRGFPVR